MTCLFSANVDSTRTFSFTASSVIFCDSIYARSASLFAFSARNWFASASTARSSASSTLLSTSRKFSKRAIFSFSNQSFCSNAVEASSLCSTLTARMQFNSSTILAYSPLVFDEDASASALSNPSVTRASSMRNLTTSGGTLTILRNSNNSRSTSSLSIPCFFNDASRSFRTICVELMFCSKRSTSSLRSFTFDSRCACLATASRCHTRFARFVSKIFFSKADARFMPFKTSSAIFEEAVLVLFSPPSSMRASSPNAAAKNADEDDVFVVVVVATISSIIALNRVTSASIAVALLFVLLLLLLALLL
mmetsp:Transcript_5789/g.19416  ORF Transcript_5789/g.19416 Transcript_5789/m.19416 type:complete len:307 (-) Transcript_5789:1431-2351(-)